VEWWCGRLFVFSCAILTLTKFTEYNAAGGTFTMSIVLGLTAFRTFQRLTISIYGYQLEPCWYDGQEENGIFTIFKALSCQQNRGRFFLPPPD
jgi:hypothetical protein